MTEFIADNLILLAGQIQANPRAARRGESASPDDALGRSPKTQRRRGAVKHFPAMLQVPAGVTMPGKPFGLGKSEALKHQPGHRLIYGAIVIDFSLHPHQFCQPWGNNIIAGSIALGPKVDFSLGSAEDPLPGLIQRFETVLNPQGFVKLLNSSDGSERRLRSLGHLARLVERKYAKVVHFVVATRE